MRRIFFIGLWSALLGMGLLGFSACSDDDPAEGNGTGQSGTSPEGNLPEDETENLPEALRNFVGFWTKGNASGCLFFSPDGRCYSDGGGSGASKGFWTYNPETLILATTLGTGTQYQVNLSNAEAWAGVVLGKNGSLVNYVRPDSTQIMEFYRVCAKRWVCVEDSAKSFTWLGDNMVSLERDAVVPSVIESWDDNNYGLEEVKFNIGPSAYLYCTYSRYVKGWENKKFWNPQTHSYYYRRVEVTKKETKTQDYSFNMSFDNPNNLDKFTLKIIGGPLEGTFVPQYDAWVYE